MTEQDLLIQSQRRKIDDLTKELEFKDRLLNEYKACVISTISHNQSLLKEINERMRNLDGYIQAEVKGKN